MNQPDLAALRDQHATFLDWIEPQRAILWALCRRLCPSACDAEDLVQEVLLSCFALLGRRGTLPRHPRAYLLRCACNIWLDRQRRSTPTFEPIDPDTLPAPTASIPPSELAEAWAVAQAHLTPREQLCVLLKDVCACSLEEIAAWMDTSTGSCKANLHRGRQKLIVQREAPRPPRHHEDHEVLERFVAAFNAQDLAALAALLHPQARVQVVGCVEELDSREALEGSIPHTFDDGHASLVALGSQPMVALVPAEDPGHLTTAARLTHDGNRITRLQWYFFCPEVLAELAAALDLPRWTELRHY